MVLSWLIFNVSAAVWGCVSAVSLLMFPHRVLELPDGFTDRRWPPPRLRHRFLPHLVFPSANLVRGKCSFFPSFPLFSLLQISHSFSSAHWRCVTVSVHTAVLSFSLMFLLFLFLSLPLIQLLHLNVTGFLILSDVRSEIWRRISCFCFSVKSFSTTTRRSSDYYSIMLIGLQVIWGHFLLQFFSLSVSVALETAVEIINVCSERSSVAAHSDDWALWKKISQTNQYCNTRGFLRLLSTKYK